MLKQNKKAIVFIIIILIAIICIINNIFIKKETIIEEIDTDILDDEEENNLINVEASKKIIVYITGQIKNPGLYELEENSRIADCIEKAGGIKDNADVTDINLATILEDEEMIYIPAKGEGDKQEESNKKSEENINNSIKTVDQNKERQQNTKVNINTATQTELEKLPGIGPSTAIKIIEYRKEKGKFKNIEEIKNVKGIGDSKYKKIKGLIKI